MTIAEISDSILNFKCPRKVYFWNGKKITELDVLFVSKYTQAAVLWNEETKQESYLYGSESGYWFRKEDVIKEREKQVQDMIDRYKSELGEVKKASFSDNVNTYE